METVLEYLEGSIGALVMAGSGILFIVLLSVVFPIVALIRDWRFGILCLLLPGPATVAFVCFYYKHKEVMILSLLTFGCLVISVTTFLLRSFLGTFFLPPDLRNTYL